jgi:hypothetical protein
MIETTPSAINRTLPRRQPNAAYRQREYLTEAEVDRLIEAARKRGRNGPQSLNAPYYYLRGSSRYRRLHTGQGGFQRLLFGVIEGSL